MIYKVIATRYEDVYSFSSLVYCITYNEEYAKAIVNALEKSEESSIFHFGYIKIDTESYNDTLSDIEINKRKKDCGYDK